MESQGASHSLCILERARTSGSRREAEPGRIGPRLDSHSPQTNSSERLRVFAACALCFGLDCAPSSWASMAGEMGHDGLRGSRSQHPSDNSHHTVTNREKETRIDNAPRSDTKNVQSAVSAIYSAYQLGTPAQIEMNISERLYVRVCRRKPSSWINEAAREKTKR